MIEERNEPTKAEMLAGLVTGTAETSGASATIQRSHRFPLHLFVQIENMARISNVPVSLIINEVIECGLEAVRQELPEEIKKQLSIHTKEQFERPHSSTSYDSKRRKPSSRSKTKASK